MSILEEKKLESTQHEPFNINRHLIGEASASQQDEEIAQLGLSIYNQDELEQGKEPCKPHQIQFPQIEEVFNFYEHVFRSYRSS